MRHILAFALLLLTRPAIAQTWFAESAQSIPSTNTGWGHITLDTMRNRLFIARRDDGLLAWDIHTRQFSTVENSKGANGVVLVAEFGRGYAAMTDGSVLTFDLTSLQPIDRTDLGAGDLNDGFYEPTQKRVHLLMGGRPDKTTWVTLDAATGQVLSRTEFNSKQMGIPVTDGEGAIFAPMRDRGLLQQLDARDLSVQRAWRLGDCAQPEAVTWDGAAHRVLIACRGDKPVFVALDPAAGVVATVPIGRGVDGVVLDQHRHLVVTANGQDGTMSVIRQDGPDSYSLVETIATRPMARVVAIDQGTQRLFTVSASFTLPVSGPPIYHPDSFTILTYRPN